MSSGESGGSLVCGFSDMASGLGGLAWNLAGGGALLLSNGEVAAAEPEISFEGETSNLRLVSPEISVDAALAPHTAPPPLEPAAPGGEVRAATCTATVEADGRKLNCPGHLTRWDRDPLEGAGTFRHLAIEGVDGSLILLMALGPPDTAGHGEEETAAWTLDPEGG